MPALIQVDGDQRILCTHRPPPPPPPHTHSHSHWIHQICNKSLPDSPTGWLRSESIPALKCFHMFTCLSHTGPSNLSWLYHQENGVWFFFFPSPELQKAEGAMVIMFRCCQAVWGIASLYTNYKVKNIHLGQQLMHYKTPRGGENTYSDDILSSLTSFVSNICL